MCVPCMSQLKGFHSSLSDNYRDNGVSQGLEFHPEENLVAVWTSAGYVHTVYSLVTSCLCACDIR